MRTARLLPLVVLLVVAVPAGLAARGPGSKHGSVRVTVLRLEGVPDALAGARLAVRVSLGAKVLYTTPRVSGREAAWNKGLRAFTSAGVPLVFELLSDRTPLAAGARTSAGEPAPGSRPSPVAARPADADETLSAGMGDLVADRGTGTLDEGIDAGDSHPVVEGRPSRAPRENPVTVTKDQVTVPRSSPILCAAPLPWPPADGEHRLDCAGMSLVVVTKAM